MKVDERKVLIKKILQDSHVASQAPNGEFSKAEVSEARTAAKLKIRIAKRLEKEEKKAQRTTFAAPGVTASA